MVWGNGQLDLPVVVARAGRVVLLKEVHLVVQVLKDLEDLVRLHIGGISVHFVLSLFAELVDVLVEFGDELVKRLLEFLGLAFLLLLQVADQESELGNLGHGIRVVAHVLLAGLVNGVLGQLSVEVTKDVNFVTNELEAVVHSVEDALLNH